MAPGIALEIMEDSGKKLRVLDPMTGSGTVVAVARSKGHSAVGVDIDPLAVLIAGVWTTPIDPIYVERQAADVLRRAQRAVLKLSVKDAYPVGADVETKQFTRYWFDSQARRQLKALACEIALVPERSVRNALWCAFSRLIITKQAGASLAMDLAHSRPHKVYNVAPTKPFDKFLAATKRVIENCIAKSSRSRGPAATILLGDARALVLRDASIDLVLTSPPYLNAIDYMRCSKFSLIWMGYNIPALRKLRANSVGTEVGMKGHAEDRNVCNVIKELRLAESFSTSNRAILARYVMDMQASLSEVARVLTPGGAAVYVLGENTVHGQFVRNSVVVSAVAEIVGLKTSERSERSLPRNRRYLPPPSKLKSSLNLDSRMSKEVVLMLRKKTASAR